MQSLFHVKKSHTDEEMAQKIKDQLFHAALYKKPQIILDFYSAGLLDPKKGEMTLYYAAKFDSLEVAKALLDCGISPACLVETNPALHEKSTLLGIAAEHGSEKMVELLLNQGLNPDEYTSVTDFQADCTPLRQAIIHIGKKPNPNIVKMLLSHGADVGKINPRGLTCLAQHGNVEELELLLKAGLSPNSDAEGESLLSRCINYGTYSLAAKLIEYGANVFEVDNSGQTYLHRSRNSTLTQLLLEKGLDVHAVDAKGRTPIDCCTDKKTAEILVAGGASIKNLSMLDPVVLSSIELTKKLIENNQANFSATDNDGKTPLRKLANKACLKGYLNNLGNILTTVPNLNVNQQSGAGGWTALHDAFSKMKGFVNFYDDKQEDKSVAECNYTKAIDLLIAHGAQPIKDRAGRTPLMCLTFNDFSVGFCRRVIERYYQFEANYYGVDPQIYRSELYHLRKTGFQEVPTPGLLGLFGCTNSAPQLDALQQFWTNIESAKKPAPRLS